MQIILLGLCTEVSNKSQYIYTVLKRFWISFFPNSNHYFFFFGLKKLFLIYFFYCPTKFLLKKNGQIDVIFDDIFCHFYFQSGFPTYNFNTLPDALHLLVSSQLQKKTRSLCMICENLVLPKNSFITRQIAMQSVFFSKLFWFFIYYFWYVFWSLEFYVWYFCHVPCPNWPSAVLQLFPTPH